MKPIQCFEDTTYGLCLLLMRCYLSLRLVNWMVQDEIKKGLTRGSRLHLLDFSS